MIHGSPIAVSGTGLRGALILAFGLALTSLAPAAPLQPAASAPAGAEVSPDRVQALIKTLENPAEREKLVSQLKALVQVQERAAPESAVKTATGELLQAPSNRITSFGRQSLEISRSVNDLQRLLAWAEEQMQGAASAEEPPRPSKPRGDFRCYRRTRSTGCERCRTESWMGPPVSICWLKPFRTSAVRANAAMRYQG